MKNYEIERFELIKVNMKGIGSNVGVQFVQTLMKIRPNLKVTVQLSIKISIWGFSILG